MAVSFSEDQIVSAAKGAAGRLGHESFRYLQLEVIIGVVSGHEVFGIYQLGVAKVCAIQLAMDV